MTKNFKYNEENPTPVFKGRFTRMVKFNYRRKSYFMERVF